MKNKNKKLKGFTLIELVVVVAIITILITIAVPRFGKANLAAKSSAHNANVKTLKNAAILYYNETGNTGNVKEELKDYLDGENIESAIEGKEFSVNIDEDGNITVTPGMVKVDGKKIREVN